MIIVITSVAALAACIFGIVQTTKLSKTQMSLSDKEVTNKILRDHITNVELELSTKNKVNNSLHSLVDNLRTECNTLRSELNACTSKNKKSAKPVTTKPTVNKPVAAKKTKPVIVAKETAKRPYKKKNA
jgi:hypothetical protein